MITTLNNSVKNIAQTLKVRPDKHMKVSSQIFKLVEASNLGGKNAVERAEIQQFIEYCLLYASKINKQNFHILQEVNSILSLKTFLVGYHLTVADILLYHVLWDAVNSFTFKEQEKYLNICRWIDNLQQDSIFYHSNELINVGAIQLLGVVTKLKI